MIMSFLMHLAKTHQKDCTKITVQFHNEEVKKVQMSDHESHDSKAACRINQLFGSL